MCLFFVRVLLETIISKMEDLVYIFPKKVLLSEYSTDYVSSSYMYLINILL